MSALTGQKQWLMGIGILVLFIATWAFVSFEVDPLIAGCALLAYGFLGNGAFNAYGRSDAAWTARK